MGWLSPKSIIRTVTQSVPEIIPNVAQALVAKEIGIPTLAITAGTEVFKSSSKAKAAQPQQNEVINMMYEPSASTVMESGGTIDVPSQPSGVYEGYAGALTQIGTGIVGGLASALRGPIGQVIGGAATGYAVGQSISGDSCGCGPKAFIRFNKCGEPIITRAMKKKAIAMVNCSGAEMAATTLGIDLVMLNQVISKQFPPRRMGISGAQLATTMRTARKLDRAHNMMQNYCKKAPVRRVTRSR